MIVAKVMKSVKPILQVVWVRPALARALVAQFPSLEKSLAQWLNGLVNSRPELVNISKHSNKKTLSTNSAKRFFFLWLPSGCSEEGNSYLPRQCYNIPPTNLAKADHSSNMNSRFGASEMRLNLLDASLPFEWVPFRISLALIVPRPDNKRSSNRSTPWQLELPNRCPRYPVNVYSDVFDPSTAQSYEELARYFVVSCPTR